MYIGSPTLIALLMVAALIYLGLLHRVLDRMRLTKGEALVLVGALILGGFLPPLPLGFGLSLNVGGMLIPAAIAAYLIITADQAAEKQRALLAAVVVAVVAGTLERLLPLERGAPGLAVDPLYMPGLLAGVVAYATGRSRRSAFCGAILGVLLLDLAAWVENIARGLRDVPVTLGGGGVFGAALIAALIAVLLAELIGEIRERLGGGPRER